MIKKQSIFAWTSIRAGDFIVFVEETKDAYKFVYLPGPSYFYMTKEEFNFAINKGILEFVEQLPKEIYEDTLEQTEKTVAFEAKKAYGRTI